MLEVELKASLEGLTVETIRAEAEQLGFVLSESLREIDCYYNGNDRDFRKSDEALRLRSCQRLPDGVPETLMTYKGPKLDAVSSSRQEYEIGVSDPETARKLLEALGYRMAFLVDKVRREFRWNGITLCLDRVAELGDYLELETLTEDGSERETAVERLLTMLDRLGVGRERLTRESYLELLAMKQ